MTDLNASAGIEPVVDVPARLGWRVHFSEISFGDPIDVTMQLLPVFPHSSPDVAADGVVFDPLMLLESARKPGEYFLLTADCGYPPDGDIDNQVCVSHPDAETIIWELDIPGISTALDFPEGTHGLLRLRFKRAEYEADLGVMLREVQSTLYQQVDVSRLTGAYAYEFLARDFPHLQSIEVGELEPCDAGEAEELINTEFHAPFRQLMRR